MSRIQIQRNKEGQGTSTSSFMKDIMVIVEITATSQRTVGGDKMDSLNPMKQKKRNEKSQTKKRRRDGITINNAEKSILKKKQKETEALAKCNDISDPIKTEQ